MELLLNSTGPMQTSEATVKEATGDKVFTTTVKAVEPIILQLSVSEAV